MAQANSQVEVLLRADVHHRVVYFLRHQAESAGNRDELGVRLDVAVDDIARMVNVDPHTVADCLEKLERARLIHRQLGAIHVAEVGKLGEFLEFLEMRERFGA